MSQLRIGIAAGILASFALVGTALGAPSNAKNSETFDLVCDNGETYEIVVNGNGEWTPGHILAGGVAIPTAFDITGTYTDPDGNEFPVEESYAKGQGKGKAGQRHEAVSCTFEFFFEDPDTGETFEAIGTVEGFLVGR